LTIPFLYIILVTKITKPSTGEGFNRFVPNILFKSKR
jgi:hypothetical protein